jgi:choline dehydrogenase-like flavoprotein
MLETYIPDTEQAHGDVTKIYADTRAESLLKSGNHVDGVKATISGKDGHAFDFHIKAKLVIVSAGTVASSELLLNSGIDVNGRVGKGVAIHPSPAMIGDFDQEINGHEGIPMGYHCHEFSVVRTGKRGYMLESVFLAPYEFSLALPGFEYEQKELMSRYPHYALIGSLLQDESVGSVTLGGPLGTILNYELTTGDAKLMIDGMKNSARVLFAAGAKSVITSHRKRTVLFNEDDLHIIDERGVAASDISIGSAHPQGGNAMGELAGASVVDSHSEVFGFDNLFVCDASVFPTSVGVNPQLTVMALALRLAEYLGENWARHVRVNHA